MREETCLAPSAATAAGTTCADAAAPIGPDGHRETSPSLLQTIRETILHALSQHERLLVVLWYVERMSIREIAEVLDLTDQQVRRTHERIVDRLREAVTPATA